MSTADAPDTLTLALEGWEGPLDLLLTLARAQKVDLREISILALVEQYLAFIDNARLLKLEIAADYLVMAAWLAYLKSGLLLPKDPAVDPSPEELALRLQVRLQRLDAMREAGARLLARDRIGRDVFARGAPEGLKLVRRAAWQADLFELFAAYGAIRARRTPAMHVVSRRPVMPLDEAIRRVEALIGARIEWTALEHFLPSGGDADYRRSALASSFLAALELAKQGKVELAQTAAFAPPDDPPRMTERPDDLVRAVEAALFAAEGPMTLAEIATAIGGREGMRAAMERLVADYAGRGIHLVERGNRWQFQTAPDLAHILRRERDEPRRLSRAGVETLAIIAYHEPVSRAEIEAIRGVQISRGTLDVLMEAGWVRPAGRREVPGRPLLYATTSGFLVHFGLTSRRDLPGIDDLRAAGLLDPVDLAVESALSAAGAQSEVEKDDADG